MFMMDCLTHILVNACKSVVMYVKSDDRQVDTEATRNNMQHCIIWTKKSQKGAKALEAAEKHLELPSRRLIRPFKFLLPI